MDNFQDFGHTIEDFDLAQSTAEQQFRGNYNVEEIQIVELESTNVWKVEKIPTVKLTKLP
jgi:hypothetical protein